MKSLKIIRFTITVLCASGLSFCTSVKKEKGNFENTEMYDIAEPKIIDLPQELDEISGIAYYAKDTSVFAIVDEDGLLFKIPIKDPVKLKEWRFDQKRDFEDVVLKDSVFYVLVSNGDIEMLTFEGDKIVKNNIDFPDASKKANEFETLYYDTQNHKLVMMCKKCEEDKKKRITSFYLNDSTKSFEIFNELETAQVKEMSGDPKEHVKPSAAAINPVTNELYILCSVNKVLLISDNKGNVTKEIKLDPVIYKQPEGMTFTPQGDLIISNEAHGQGFGQLLIIKNKKKG
jgi:uncharacterized protein YjiK